MGTGNHALSPGACHRRQGADRGLHCVVMEFTDDKACTQRHCFDMASLLRQLGVAG